MSKNEFGYYPAQYGITQKHYSNSNGVTWTNVPEESSVSSGIWNRQSETTPYYRQIIRSKKRHSLPMNNFRFESTKFDGCSAYRRIKIKDIQNGVPYWSEEEELGYFLNGTQDLTGYSSDIFEDLGLKARAKLLTKLKSQSINLAVAVGEGTRTVNLIATKAKQIAKAGLALRKGNLQGAARALGVPPKGKSEGRSRRQTLAQNWLELQYGWKPLLNDIYGGAQFLANQNNWVQRSVIRSSATRETTRKSVVESDLQTRRTVQTDTYTVKYVVYFAEPSGGSPRTALGLSNPLAVAWELVPFSFVVDWFLPLGDFFSNVDATIGSTFVKGCLTEFWRANSRQTTTGKTIVNGDYSYQFETNMSLPGAGIYCQRVVMNDFPSNSIPRFKNPISGQHVANALALVAQVFSGAPVKNLRL